MRGNLTAASYAGNFTSQTVGGDRIAPSDRLPRFAQSGPIVESDPVAPDLRGPCWRSEFVWAVRLSRRIRAQLGARRLATRARSLRRQGKDGATQHKAQ